MGIYQLFNISNQTPCTATYNNNTNSNNNSNSNNNNNNNKQMELQEGVDSLIHTRSLFAHAEKTGTSSWMGYIH